MAAKTLITVEDFVKIETAETEADELVDGELVPLSSPTPLQSEGLPEGRQPRGPAALILKTSSCIFAPTPAFV